MAWQCIAGMDSSDGQQGSTYVPNTKQTSGLRSRAPPVSHAGPSTCPAAQQWGHLPQSSSSTWMPAAEGTNHGGRHKPQARPSVAWRRGAEAARCVHQQGTWQCDGGPQDSHGALLNSSKEEKEGQAGSSGATHTCHWVIRTRRTCTARARHGMFGPQQKGARSGMPPGEGAVRRSMQLRAGGARGMVGQPHGT